MWPVSHTPTLRLCTLAQTSLGLGLLLLLRGDFAFCQYLFSSQHPASTSPRSPHHEAHARSGTRATQSEPVRGRHSGSWLNASATNAFRPAHLALLLLQLLLCECLDRQRFQAFGLAHTRLRNLNQPEGNRSGNWVSTINQAEGFQHVLEDVAEHGDLFGRKGALLIQQLVDWHAIYPPESRLPYLDALLHVCLYKIEQSYTCSKSRLRFGREQHANG